VHGGDRIAASLRRTSAGWRLAIVDASTGVSRRFVTADEASGPFTLAEWLQEDPTASRTGAAVAYPQLAGGRFEQLRVNSRTPARRSLLSQWMSIPRGDIAPSPISADAFSYHRATLGRGWRRYRHVVAPEDAASEAFLRAASLWNADTPRAAIATASAAFAAALRANLAVLASQHWPQSVRPLIAALIHHVRSLLHVIEAAPAAAGDALVAWMATYHRHGRGVSAIGMLIRQHLHGPVLVA
jgi:hypothetical protein